MLGPDVGTGMWSFCEFRSAIGSAAFRCGSLTRTPRRLRDAVGRTTV